MWWPFSMVDRDRKDSQELVSTLSVPESTKKFVFAIRVPEHGSTIYLLSAQSFCQSSARDVECLIRELRPDAVVAQVNDLAFGEAQALEDGSADSMPTSAFGVFTRCVLDTSFDVEDRYESDFDPKRMYGRVAEKLVLKEIFGTSFNGHILAAKKVAEEVGSSFMVLESPFLMEGLSRSLRAQYYGGSGLGSTRFRKELSSHITQLSKELKPSSCVASEAESDSQEVPQFAISISNSLVGLHNMFSDLPAIRKSLDSARTVLCDVNRGESIDTQVLSEVYIFRTALEGLRIALNNAGRQRIWNLGSLCRAGVQFSKLSSMEKSYALMADDLRSQAKKFKKIVAVVDAGNLAGLRRHWRTCVPQEVKDMSTGHKIYDFDSNDSKLKPVVAVGAGALTLSKAISASPVFKISTLKAPLKLCLTHTHKAMSFAFTKVAYPFKVMAPVFDSSAVKSMKPSLSTLIIGAVTQYILSCVKVKSLSAVQASLYTSIMRKRRAKPIGTLPLVVFGGSLATCTGLIYYHERIVFAAETLPSARSIAKLGRGIQNLREASPEVPRKENNRIQNAMENFSQRLKNFTLPYSISLNFKTKSRSYPLIL